MIKFKVRRDFDSASSCYLAGQTYSVADDHAKQVQRWRNAGLVQVDGEAELPPQPRTLAITVSRPAEFSSRRRGSVRDYTMMPKATVDHDYLGPIDPDTIRVIVAPGAWTTDELRAMVEHALAVIEAGR